TIAEIFELVAVIVVGNGNAGFAQTRAGFIEQGGKLCVVSRGIFTLVRTAADADIGRTDGLGGFDHLIELIGEVFGIDAERGHVEAEFLGEFLDRRDFDALEAGDGTVEIGAREFNVLDTAFGHGLERSAGVLADLRAESEPDQTDLFNRDAEMRLTRVLSQRRSGETKRESRSGSTTQDERIECAT